VYRALTCQLCRSTENGGKGFFAGSAGAPATTISDNVDDEEAENQKKKDLTPHDSNINVEVRLARGPGGTAGDMGEQICVRQPK
jgi:hypothetical protein